MSALRNALVPVSLLIAVTALAEGNPPASQATLDTWWGAAGKTWMGETVYQIGEEGITFQDGVCSIELTSGRLVPVYSGQEPVSERIVGMIFQGEGSMSMPFPSRADAWTFANHMANNTNIDTERLLPVVERGEPFVTTIDRGLLLSADPQVIDLLYNLEPVGSGVMLQESADGEVDEAFIVTDSRGRLLAKASAVNVLADRTRQLGYSGLDPKAIIRQDRLLHEEMGLSGENLRMIADFRTDTSFRVASGDGAGLGGDAYDRWLTCYRDGQDLAGTGYRTMAFSHGIDGEQSRHFMRFSGELFHPLGAPSPYQPPVRMEPVFAESNIEVRPFRRSLEQQAIVESTLTLKAVGADIQHVAMRMPTGTSIANTWELLSLTDERDRELARVGLYAGLTSSFSDGIIGGQLDNDVSGGLSDTSTTDSSSSNDPLSSSSTESDGIGDVSESASSGASTENLAFSEQEFFQQREQRREMLVMLPQPVPEGEEVTLKLKWKTNWKFANFAISDNVGTDGSTVVRSLGPTTGPQPILPEILPSPGGSIWESFRTTLGTPTPVLRSLSTVSAGETEKSWIDDGNGWQWSVSQGKNARRPSVALGRWYNYQEPAAQDLPAISVNLFPSTGEALPMFPPEVRRVVAFLERFLPDYPLEEVAIYQGPSALPLAAMTTGFRQGNYGMVGIQRISNTSVTATGSIRRDSPYLAQMMIARQVAGQYWGQSIAPASSRDEWLLESLADAYAFFYIRAAFGFDAYADMMQARREALENPREISMGQGSSSNWKNREAKSRSYSLTGAPTMTDVPSNVRGNYSAYVISEMLRNRLGDEIFFTAIDQLAQERRGKRVTTELFQTILEENSGQDLSNFFDYWIHNAFIPSINVSILKNSGDVARGCIETNVPFGIFDVPIRVVDQDGERMVEALVDVVNGTGYFEVPGREGDFTVEVDPYGMVLAFDRDLKEVRELPCERDSSADAIEDPAEDSVP
ncbi:MAG: hypothetical protein P8R54_31210 [Myxococcota bacterium]|nr:hypothetical protein [Myxococcota bacterium]